MAVNDQLRALVHLETLYPYEIQVDLRSGGKPCSGLYCPAKKQIVLNARLQRSPKSFIAVYLHEVGHLIAHRYLLDDSPDAAAHNQYFGVLVAVMYRRANILDRFEIYDFCDTTAGQRFDCEDAPILDDANLIKRFDYILRRSSEFEKTSLTIEQIAHKLFYEDVLKHWRTGEFDWQKAKPISWTDMIIGAVYGVALTCGVLAAVIATLF